MGLLSSGAAWLANVKYYPQSPDYKGPVPLPAEISKQFAYEPTTIEARLGLDEKTTDNPDFTRYLGDLSFKDGGERSIPIMYYKTKHAARAPLFFVSPAISERFERFYERVCAIFAKGGVSTIALKNYTNFVDPANGPAELQQVLVRAVADAQRAVDWVLQDAQKPDSQFDPNRLGSFGISLGGIKNLTWLAVDHRPKCNIIVLAAGGLADILSVSKDSDVRAYWDSRKQKLGCTDEQLHAELKENIFIDPIYLAPHVDASKMLYIKSTKDDVVPSELQQKTYEALGKPEAYSLSTGHDISGIKFVLGYMSKKISEFVTGKLGMPPP